MWFRRRYRTPWWLLLIGVLGIRSWWIRAEMSPEQRESYRAKRRQFRDKIQEAFDVWKHPNAESTVDSQEDEP